MLCASKEESRDFVASYTIVIPMRIPYLSEEASENYERESASIEQPNSQIEMHR